MMLKPIANTHELTYLTWPMFKHDIVSACLWINTRNYRKTKYMIPPFFWYLKVEPLETIHSISAWQRWSNWALTPVIPKVRLGNRWELEREIIGLIFIRRWNQFRFTISTNTRNLANVFNKISNETKRKNETEILNRCEFIPKYC